MLPFILVAETVLRSDLEIGGDRRDAGADVGDTVDDDHAVGAAADHAEATPCIAESGHRAQDTNSGGKERGRDRLAGATLEWRTVKGDSDKRRRRQIPQDWVGIDTSRSEILFSSGLAQRHLLRSPHRGALASSGTIFGRGQRAVNGFLQAIHPAAFAIVRAGHVENANAVPAAV